MSDGPSGPLASMGGEFTISVTTNAGCAWTASSGAGFVAPVGATSVTGPGSVKFAVQPNDGAQRSGVVTVAGRGLTISQSSIAPQTCEFNVTPTEVSAAASGGDITVTVTATSGVDCPRTASSNSSFIAVKSGSSGSGTGTVVLTLANNTGAARVGQVTVAGQAVTVLQDGFVACPFNVAPTQTTAPAGGGNVVVTLTSSNGPSCAWIAISQSSGLTVAPPSGGSGNGSVTLAVGANPGTAARTLTALVGGQQVRIDQTGSPVACGFSISPASLQVTAAGGGTMVTIQNTQGTACQWSSLSSAPWINVISGAGGIGNGTTSISVQPNNGAARNGTVTIAGNTFSVQQDAATSGTCAFSVTPSSVAIGAEQTFVTIRVTNTQGVNCPWTATPSVTWIGFMQGGPVINGYGSDTFQVVVGRNTGSARSASVDVSGHTVTINQAATSLPANAAAVISFESDPGDYIGQGQSRSYTFVGPNQFSLQFDRSRGTFTFATVLGFEPNLFIHFQSPEGQDLAPGYFPRALRPASAPPQQPGLDVGWDHRGCNSLTGRFAIGQMTVDSSGVLQRIQATFQQHCEHRSASIRGTIWIDLAGSTSPPAPPVLPTPSSPTTLFAATSDPGDVLGNGASSTYTLANAVFIPRGSSSQAEVSILPASGGSMFFRIAAPSGNLAVGTYDSVPVSASGSGSNANGIGGCSAGITGKFTILEYTHGPNGDLYTFRIRIELRCGTATAAYRVEINVFADPWR